jgi:hypothetical protein
VDTVTSFLFRGQGNYPIGCATTLHQLISLRLSSLPSLCSLRHQRHLVSHRISMDNFKARIRVRLKKAGNASKECLKIVLWNTCKCLLYTICSPVICCAVICMPDLVENPGDTGRYLQKPQFPTPRRRALSVPLVHATSSQKTLPQPHSKLMTKLYVTSSSSYLWDMHITHS